MGGLALCRAAKAALVLSRLNLSLNLLTDTTLLAVADALRFNTGTLKEVAVAGCRAGEESAISVIRAATKNNSLQLLDLRGIPLGPEVGGPECMWAQRWGGGGKRWGRRGEGWAKFSRRGAWVLSFVACNGH